jgi:hypothetical protein
LWIDGRIVVAEAVQDFLPDTGIERRIHS